MGKDSSCETVCFHASLWVGNEHATLAHNCVRPYGGLSTRCDTCIKAVQHSPRSELRAAAAGSKCTRRHFLHVVTSTSFSLLALPTIANSGSTPTEPLYVSLQNIVRARDGAEALATDASITTNADVRRVIKTLVKGSNIIPSAREASKWLPEDSQDKALQHAKAALEFLDQASGYFASTDVRSPPRGENLVFCLRALQAAADEFDSFLGFFK